MRHRPLWRLAAVPFAGSLVLGLVAGLAGPAHAQDDDDEMTFEPDEVAKPSRTATPPPDTTPPSKVLERADMLYEKKDYYSASIELAKVINGETDDSPANKQTAEFVMAKTLYQMGFYAASLAYFDRIVQLGTGHRYYNVTLKWLAALSRVLPETSGILEKIGGYDPSDLLQPVLEDVRDELYYLLGQHFYRRGDFDQAINLFQSVRQDSAFFIKAKFFEGVTYVRRYEGKPAVSAFQEILIIGEERPDHYTRDEIDNFVDLANLQLARVFYSTQQYELSIKYYEKLPQAAPDWLPSLFEASWAYFMITMNSKALGNIHTLQAPYFENEFFPGMAEGILLKAVIYYRYCQYERALEAVADFDQRYRPLRNRLQDLLKKFDDNTEFYDFVKKILARQAGLDDQTQALALSSLRDRTLEKTFAWVDELDKELAMLEKADKAWQTTRIAAEVLQELTVQKSLAEADAGKLARERIERLSNELRELSRDGGRIKFEVLNQQAGQVSARAQGEQISGDNKPEPIIVDDEHFMWKFNGEWWKDELGYYRFRIASRCPKRGAGN
jgi:tetratricopeptide (TPR) repeat protein